jgi:outer membrane receptor for ferrienterochelin and colicin
MLDNRVYKYLNNIETPENKQIDYTSQEIENKFRYEGSSETGPYKLLYGAGFEYAKYLNKTFQKVFIDTSVVEKNYEVALNMAKYHAFGQATRSFIDSRLSLSLGLRIDANNYSDEMSNPFDQLSPRFSASYLLTEKVTLNYNMGRYYQLPPYTSLGYQNTAGEFVNRNNGIKYITADHFVLGAEFQPTASSRISVEGFYKIYSDYPFSLIDSISLASKGADYGVFGDEPLTPTSDGRAYGIELVFRDKSIKGFNMLMAYTLVRSEFTDYDKNYVPSAWDNKHILNFTLTRMLKKNWDIGLKWRFVGGAPYTPWDMDKSSIKEAWDVKGQGYLDYSLFNTERLKAFHQLDIRVDKEYFFDNWSLMLYLDIQNLYNFQSESQSILVNYDEQGVVHQYTDNQGVERYQLREIPSSSGTILPTVGIMVEF